jgi:hypothetical protein
MAFAAAELYWLRMLFHDLGVSLSLLLMLCCDNIRAIVLASNPFFHAHTKYVEV